MKIAIVSDWYRPRLGGLELHIRDLAAELADRGADVHVVTPTRADPGEQGWRLPTLELTGPDDVRVHRLDVPLLPRYKFAFTPGVGRALDELFRRERFDLVHVMIGIVTPVSMAAARLAVQRGLPTVVTFHSVLFGFRPVLVALDRLAGWSRWPVVFTAVSRALADDAGRLTGGRPVHVLPNGVDAESWGKVVHEPGEPDELRLLSVMRLNPRKRGGALLKAVARARREAGPRARIALTLVGDGPQGARLRRMARAPGLRDAVRFTGHLGREGVAGEMACADAFVAASVLESFGVAALEARAAGVPVVARASGGVPEFIAHGREGLLAESDEELAGALVRLATEPGLLAGLRKKIQGSPVRFTWEESARRHLEVYGAALRGEEPGPFPPSSPPAAPRNGRLAAPAAARPCG